MKLFVLVIGCVTTLCFLHLWSSNNQNSHRSRINRELTEIVDAICFHDNQSRIYTDTSTKCLWGRYLDRKLKDPWGRDYLVDHRVGVVVTYGADGKPGGTGQDNDYCQYYKPPLGLFRVKIGAYESISGQWVTTIVLFFTKPFILRDLSRLVRGLVLSGKPLESKQGELGLRVSNRDRQANIDGVLMLDVTRNADLIIRRWGLKGTMSLNPDYDTDSMVDYGLEELVADNGPLDANLFGEAAREQYQRSPTADWSKEEINQGIEVLPSPMSGEISSIRAVDWQTKYSYLGYPLVGLRDGFTGVIPIVRYEEDVSWIGAFKVPSVKWIVACKECGEHSYTCRQSAEVFGRKVEIEPY